MASHDKRITPAISASPEGIESIKKRALRIIFAGNSFTISSYHSFCDSMAISSLYDRKDKLSTDFSTKFFTRQAVSITSSQIRDITTKQIIAVIAFTVCPKESG